VACHYLTPPSGMNLFLASYHFERPLAEIFLSAAQAGVPWPSRQHRRVLR
jgi:hypothetical protein